MAISEIYSGRIANINLTTGKIETIDTETYAKQFLGGRGIATALYWDMVPAQATAFSEDNCLIITLGPLSGMPGGLGGSRWGVYGKSPLPAVTHRNREHFCYGSQGGTFGSELRFAGYDGLVINGIAESPVYISIIDNEILIKPANDLWGKSTGETMQMLTEKSPNKSRFLTIGPAGENMVPLATVFASGGSSSSGGMGAVMGGKNLKGIAVKGSNKKVAVGNREGLKDIEKAVRGYNRGNVKVWGLDFMAHGPNTKKYPCFGCMAHCLRVRYTAKDGTTGKFMCQSRFFYMHHAWGYYSEDNDVPFFANHCCDEYGIDTWEVQTLIEWLLLCHSEGLVSVNDTGLELDKVGSLEFIQNLVKMTSLKEGFGEILSKGSYGAGKELGKRAGEIYTRTDPYDPRYCTVNTLLFPFDSREPIQQLHEAGLVLSQWSSWAKGVPEAHISSDVIKGIAKRFWGSEHAGDMTTLKGKAMAAKRIQERQLAKECAGLCDWMFPVIDIPAGDEHVGDPTIESNIISAALGENFTEEDFYLLGERVFNLQRAVLLREGHIPENDDFLPKEWHDNPIETHVADPECIVPDGDGKVVSQIGRRVEMNDFIRLRDDYYKYRGWDVRTGLQSVAGLSSIGLGYVAEDLKARGMAVDKSRGLSLLTKAKRSVVLLKKVIPSKDKKDDNNLMNEYLAGESLIGDELISMLKQDVLKYNNEKIAHNFKQWTKAMQYYFTDTDEYYCIEFVNGTAQNPVRLSEAVAKPEISYEMDTRILKAMSDGTLGGEQAYLKRLLRLKASFTDMMKLQSLKKL